MQAAAAAADCTWQQSTTQCIFADLAQPDESEQRNWQQGWVKEKLSDNSDSGFALLLPLAPWEQY